MHYISGSQTVVRVPPAVREGLEGGTRDPSVLLHKKKTFCFYLSGSVNKFLNFRVPPLNFEKWPLYFLTGILFMPHLCLVCQTFDRMILARMRFPGARCF